jgi:hypothetical protein
VAPLQRFDGAARFDRNRYREERSDAAIQGIVGIARRETGGVLPNALSAAALDRHASLAMTTEVIL